MNQNIKQIFPSFLDGILNSYTQIFFSNQKVFAVILLMVTFFDWMAGLSGLLAVLSTNLSAYLIGFNRLNIKSGYYGFNSLLVGLGLGIYYNFGLEYLMILVFASAFTLFVTVMLEGIIGKYGLPYLSIPFLFGIWMVTLASREFTALSISERGIFLSNELYDLGGISFIWIYDWVNNINLHESIIIYFRSLGAIFFQYSLLAGFVIAIGLLIYSRIAFILSLLGFFSAYLFYQFVGGNIYELSYSYIGFNFILTAIAIGGFFIVPSRYSYLWVILLTPILSITITSTMAIMGMFQLSIYSLPFNIIVLLFLYILKFRERYYNKPEMVAYQQFSPEKNLYSHLNASERFHQFKYVPILLPFYGEWAITQAHNGKYTHKEDWAHAWDFEIKDEEGKTFANSGRKLSDFYCYNKPVIAPADGVVEELIDFIEDNDIGDMNLEQNWGNTIVIKHQENLYTKLSHLKPGTFKVKKGDQVNKGDVLASCGNSGRSPEPHLHFQVQETPFIGSKTLDYPIGNYVLKDHKDYLFKSYDRPLKNDIVCNIKENSTLFKAFHFVPGQQIKFEIADSSKTISWEVKSSILNQTFLECSESKAKAWFKNDGNIFYFSHFEGNKNSLLFYFYLAAYKVPTGFYKKMEITDTLPINTFGNKWINFAQDIIAPFHIFVHLDFRLEFIRLKDYLSESNITFSSSVAMKYGKQLHKKLTFALEIESNRVKNFVIEDGDNTIELREISTT